ncbi:MAG: undecaprenyl/decaprenyl-phosphate alpha-N-acetylglucosaminyl 1-phosphate transferase [Chitinophagales bacterium]|nr:undecaprenyl/decaprenyl-phosphate alpha-N-acetylglucosaminyl 1-phosphate transferase [Chitinophagales bacterium]
MSLNLNPDTIFLYIAYVCFFLLSVIFSLLINGLLIRFTRTLGNRQIQHQRHMRWSSSVKPSIGGFSFYILFLVAVSMTAIFNLRTKDPINEHLLGLIFSASIGFLIGLADDAYNTNPLLKFLGQVTCGISLVATGTYIHATGIYLIDVLITLMWVAGIMNSINMLDNMDGISGIVSLFILFACFLVLLIEKDLFSVYSILLIGVAGSITGFLFYNWNPARIYMGDTGSQFLGAFISSMSIRILWKFHDPAGSIIQFRQFLIPLIAFTIPFIDTGTVVIRRIARGQSPFIGGKDHISHHFAYAGLSDQQVIFLLGGISFLSALITSVIVYVKEQLNETTIILFYSYFFLLFFIVQYFYNRGKRKQINKSHRTETDN